MLNLCEFLIMSLCPQWLISLLYTLSEKCLFIYLFFSFFLQSHEHWMDTTALCYSLLDFSLFVLLLIQELKLKILHNKQPWILSKSIHVFVHPAHVVSHLLLIRFSHHRHILGFPNYNECLEGVELTVGLRWSVVNPGPISPQEPSMRLFIYVLTTSCVQSIRTKQHKHCK